MSSTLTITLPDGSSREMPAGSTPADVAAAIGPGLAKAALAARVDGELVDLSRPFTGDAALALVTARDEAEALDLARHDFAHVLAEAVQALFPGTQITFGPSTDDGFYYDFAPDRTAAVHRRGPARDRGGNAADHRRRQAAHPRSVAPRCADRPVARGGRELQGRMGGRTARGRGADGLSVAEATGSTCAAVRTCPRPASSIRQRSS